MLKLLSDKSNIDWKASTLRSSTSSSIYKNHTLVHQNKKNKNSNNNNYSVNFVYLWHDNAPITSISS